MLRRTRTTIVSVAASVATGCMSFGGGYPMNWPDRVELVDEECPSLDGRYRNDGSMFHEQGTGYVQEAVGLSSLLGGWADADDQRLDFAPYDAVLDGYTEVSLALAGKTLRVRVDGADREPWSFDVPVRYECENSLMKLDPDWNIDTLVVVSMVDRSSLQLGRATDGSLLAHTRSAAGLFLWYVPLMGGSDERWLRFPAVQPGTHETAAVASSD